MRNKIVQAAKQTVGTAYHSMGRKVGVGLDCVGVVVHCAQAIQYPYVDCKRYSEKPGQKELFAYLDANFEEIELDKAQPGDILVFWFREKGVEQHLAMKSDLGMIHIYNTVGRVVEHGIDEFWQKRLLRAYQFKNVEDFTGIPKEPAIKEVKPKRSCCGGSN